MKLTADSLRKLVKEELAKIKTITESPKYQGAQGGKFYMDQYKTEGDPNIAEPAQIIKSSSNAMDVENLSKKEAEEGQTRWIVHLAKFVREYEEQKNIDGGRSLKKGLTERDAVENLYMLLSYSQPPMRDYSPAGGQKKPFRRDLHIMSVDAVYKTIANTLQRLDKDHVAPKGDGVFDPWEEWFIVSAEPVDISPQQIAGAGVPWNAWMIRNNSSFNKNTQGQVKQPQTSSSSKWSQTTSL